MNFRMTKKEAVQQFRWDWSDFLKSNPSFRGDSIAKRCAFNDYVDSLTNDEKKFYDDNQEKYNLGICDKYNTVETRLIYIEYDFEFLSDKGIEECEKNNYTALSEEAFEELVTL